MRAAAAKLCAQVVGVLSGLAQGGRQRSSLDLPLVVDPESLVDQNLVESVLAQRPEARFVPITHRSHRPGDEGDHAVGSAVVLLLGQQGVAKPHSFGAALQGVGDVQLGEQLTDLGGG
jgi:hypothetical protein